MKWGIVDMIRKKLKFLRITKDREFLNRFKSDKEYDRETLKTIRKIEKDIIKASKNGLYRVFYDNVKITSWLNAEKIKAHFEENGFEINIEFRYISNHMGVIYDKYSIDIHWNENIKYIK